MKRSEIRKTLPDGVTDAQLRKAIGELELPATDGFEYSAEQVAAIQARFAKPKSQPTGATTFPHPAQSETTAIDIASETQSQGELAIQHKIETLTDAQRRGTALANEEAVTELAAYVTTAGKRRKQLNGFMAQYRQNLNGALSELAPEVVSAEDADFFGQPPQFSTQSTAGNLQAG